MYKNIFLSLSLVLLSGCAERGYKLTVNNHTHTAIAQSNKNIDADIPDTATKLEKMKKAVKDELTHDIKSNTKQSKASKTQYRKKFDTEMLLASSTNDLIFKRLNQTYQKFGNSEIHGHIIYLSPVGSEIRLKDTHIYLLKENATLNNWYKKAYLQDKNLGNPIHVEYNNVTYLDLTQNFAFHGIAPGSYYVIIVSDMPKSEDKKVYIAKKIKVEKRKKIMAVFSKKLSKKPANIPTI